MKKICNVIFMVSCLLSSDAIAQCTTASTVPYYEDFSGVTTTSPLPACWAVSNTLTCLTPLNGPTFYFFPNGTSHFYSNAIHLQAGIIYSVSIGYKVSQSSVITWTNLSISLGTSQSTAGLVTLVSMLNAVHSSYTILSNTFAVNTTGDYYVAIGVASTAYTGPQYLWWDDLTITIPCTPAYNTPSVTIASGASVACAGTPVTFTAAGADSYLWSNGATTEATSFGMPPVSSLSVIGTNTLTGCSKTTSLTLNVHPSPDVMVFVNNPLICAGTAVNIYAVGASNYTWSSGQQTSGISVSPSVTTTYSVTGSNTFGCPAIAAQVITVNPLPVISVAASNTVFCIGEQITLTASGADSFQWNTPTGSFNISSLSFIGNSTTTFTIIGTDANACSSGTNYVVKIGGCAGLGEARESGNTLRGFPNPGNGVYTIASGNPGFKSIAITDIAGKNVLSMNSLEESFSIDLTAFPAGMYHVSIQSAMGAGHLKLIKY